jgi:tight adherence protein B
VTATLLAAAAVAAAVLAHGSSRRPTASRTQRARNRWPGEAWADLRERWETRRRDGCALWAEAADVWAAQLTAGAAPSTGLIQALASGTPVMQRAARSIELGADADEVLEVLSRRPGHDGAAVLRACWTITVSVGGAAAQTVRRAGDALRDEAGVRAEIRAQLAAPRATARLVAALPIAGPLLGALLGVDTVQVLTATSAGRTLLVAGLAMNALGVLWVHRLISSAERAV